MFVRDFLNNIFSRLQKAKILKSTKSRPENLTIKGPLFVEILGTITLGNNVFIRSSAHNKVEINVSVNGKLILDDNVFINQGARIVCTNQISIGKRTLIGDEVLLIDNDFHSKENIVKNAPIIIENDVWIASRVIVLRGVRIGHGSVVGAGAVVTKSIPANSFAAGTPARVIKPIKKKLNNNG